MSGEQLSDVLHQVLVQPEVHDLLLELSQFLLCCQQLFESVF